MNQWLNPSALSKDVEYSRTGTVIKGQERAKAKSKYDEDGESFGSFSRLACSSY